ncbi:MAG: plasmid pRiA4b ORF-3 family protein [Dysgonamonadaceae bacterium]
MPNKTYQVKITLKGSKPSIWRQVLIPSDLSLPDFHKVIQTTMGWTNSHLHQFIKNRTYYAPKMPDDIFWDEADNVDYSKLKISDLLKKEKEKIIYEYDFGDGWEHEIVLEKIENKVMDKKDVTCLKGKNSCPPEDCGGIWGYYDMLEILKDPDHEEYEDYSEWLGVDFDPTYFDIEEVNEMLGSKNFGTFDLSEFF